MVKLQFYANRPFMLYMPYSTPFVQENTSHDQESPKFAKVNSLQASYSLKRENSMEHSPLSTLQARSRSQDQLASSEFLA